MALTNIKGSSVLVTCFTLGTGWMFYNLAKDQNWFSRLGQEFKAVAIQTAGSISENVHVGDSDLTNMVYGSGPLVPTNKPSVSSASLIH